MITARGVKWDSDWDLIQQFAEKGSWGECLQALGRVIGELKPEAQYDFDQIGREILRVAGAGESGNAISPEDLVLRVASRTAEISRALRIHFPLTDEKIQNIQILIAAGTSSAWTSIAAKFRNDLRAPRWGIEAAGVALRLNPSNAAALTTRAASHTDLKDYENAKRDLATVRTIDSASVQAAHLRAKILREQGDLVLSLRTALWSFHEVPSDIGARQVGSGYAALGDKRTAVAWYERAGELGVSAAQEHTKDLVAGYKKLAKDSAEKLASEYPTAPKDP